MAWMQDTYLEAISMIEGLKRLTATAFALAVLAVGLAATATAGTAAPKPGFLPGTWIGQGTIGGSVTDGLMTTKFDGRVTFVVKVNNKLGVSGAGSWRQTMFGTQDAPAQYGVGAMITGTGAIALKGTSTKVTFFGKQKLLTEIRAGSRKTTKHESEADLSGRLVITKATQCQVSGKTEVQPGVTLTWSAKFKGACG
jgi:hypothetical protein